MRKVIFVALLSTLGVFAVSPKSSGAELLLGSREKMCSRGPTKTRIICLENKVSKLTEEIQNQNELLSRLQSAVMKLDPTAITTTMAQTEKRSDVDQNSLIKYGDKIRIRHDKSTCLHAGLFAGFEGCDLPKTDGFYFERAR